MAEYKSIRDLYIIGRPAAKVTAGTEITLPFIKHPDAKYARIKGNIYCAEYAPMNGYMCTRAPGHLGEHEAHTAEGSPCLNANKGSSVWGEYVKPTLPEKPWQQVYFDHTAGIGWCGVTNDGVFSSFVCTRPEGHTGAHETVVSDVNILTPAWWSVHELVDQGTLEAIAAPELSQAEKELAPYSKIHPSARLAVFPEKFYGGSGKHCGATSPTGTYYCSLAKDHIGPHEAHFSKYVACCEPWANEEEAETVKKFEYFPAIYEYADSSNWCDKKNPNATWYCRRANGHTGPHQATTGNGYSAYDEPWEDPAPTLEYIEDITKKAQKVDEESPF